MCLLLGRERVLQYERHLRDERGSRNYEVWDPPKTGPDVRRRVLVVWEDDHGRYCVADHNRGGISGYDRHDTLQEAFARVHEHDAFMRAGCTSSACMKRVLQRVEEEGGPDVNPSMITVGYALELLTLLGARFPKGEFWCEHSDSPDTIVLTVTVWPGVRLAVNVCDANSEQRVFFEIRDWHGHEDPPHVADTIGHAVEHIATRGAPSPET